MSETVTVGLFADGTDETTGDPTRVLVTSRYVGKARVKYPSLGVSERSEPSNVFAVQQTMLSIPTGAPELREGDEVSVTGSTVDTGLVGRRYKIAGAAQAGQTTSHRYPLTELT